MAKRRSLAVCAQLGFIADQRQVAWQIETEPGAIVDRYPWPGIGTLGFDDQSTVYPTTLETWTRGRPPSYADCSILLMAVVQTV